MRLPTKQKTLRKPLVESNVQNNNNKINKREKGVRSPYMGRPSENLAAELRRYGHRMGFYPVSTVSPLISLTDSVFKKEKSGVHQISSIECLAFHTGQTGRNSEKRTAESEYRTVINNSNTDTKSAYIRDTITKK